MRNKYLRRARVLERDFRAVLRCFARADRHQNVWRQQEHRPPALRSAATAGGRLGRGGGPVVCRRHRGD